MTPRILYLGNNTTDLTVTFALSGIRYEFWLPNSTALSVVEHLAKHVSLGKALAYTIRHSLRSTQLTA